MTLITNIDYIYLPKFCQNFNSANTYWVLNINVTISYGSVYWMVQFHISTSNGRSESLSFSVVFSFYLLKSCLQNSWHLYELREIRAIFFTRDCFYVLCALELCFLSHTMVCWCRWISQNEKWIQTCGFIEFGHNHKNIHRLSMPQFILIYWLHWLSYSISLNVDVK